MPTGGGAAATQALTVGEGSAPCGVSAEVRLVRCRASPRGGDAGTAQLRSASARPYHLKRVLATQAGAPQPSSPLCLVNFATTASHTHTGEPSAGMVTHDRHTSRRWQTMAEKCVLCPAHTVELPGGRLAASTRQRADTCFARHPCVCQAAPEPATCERLRWRRRRCVAAGRGGGRRGVGWCTVGERRPQPSRRRG